MKTQVVTLTVTLNLEQDDDPGFVAQDICEQLLQNVPTVKEAEWDYDDEV